MSKKSKRLQGKDWYTYRKEHKLLLVGIYKSSNGNYRADVVDENNKSFHHWLHPIEAAKLEKSGYLSQHPAVDSSTLFNKEKHICKK